MAKTAAIQRSDEKSVPIHSVKFEYVADRVNKMFESVAKRAYEVFEANGKTSGHYMDDWFTAHMQLLRPVRVDITKSGEQLELRAEVPGFSDTEIQVAVEPQRLTISGIRGNNLNEKNGETIYTEFSSDQILRVVDLPIAVDAEKVKASLKSGILHVVMPTAPKARLIEMKGKVA